jgi:hypothetical protein
MAVPAAGLARGVGGLPARSSLLPRRKGWLKPVGKPLLGLYGLTLGGVGREVTWFADHADRDAGLLAAPRLFGDRGRLGFRKCPPNAALVVTGAAALRADRGAGALIGTRRLQNDREIDAISSCFADGWIELCLPATGLMRPINPISRRIWPSERSLRPTKVPATSTCG